MSNTETNLNQASQDNSDQRSETGKQPLSRSLFVGLGVAALLLAGVIYLGIHQRAMAASNLGAVTERAAIATVNVAEPKSGASLEEIVLPGTTQAFIDTPIFARTNGYLKKWYFDIGAHVEQGQLLAVIETPELDQQLGQARANLKTAQANERLAEITATRWQGLLTTDSVSKQSTDVAVQDLSAKQATVESMTADVQRLEQLQSYEKVYAPFSGVITARNTDIGALINEGAGGSQGQSVVLQELFHMAAVNRLRIFVSVPEVDSDAAQNGAKVPLTLDEFPGETFQGTIVRNSDAIDLNSRTLNVEVDIDNRDGRLKPGAYVFVHLKLPDNSMKATHSLIIPANTLLFRSEGLQVGVVRGNHAELMPITIGRDYGATVEVINGLKPTDQVIVNPSDSLTSGSPVQVSAPQAGGSK
ncbi:efflux RND transporter periplasmic adaptor subunit [Acidicapsa acidisoli]|uniref:efflux RND transporter periplasmic adaptor subunit n=1 Tax=Acidicapsa acidisoli TaxID=1615681 RepID=UPI0021DF74BC|nr:efflux RND transporter periplasmic adaptor subunit [Acidicapsa acidisoli]